MFKKNLINGFGKCFLLGLFFLLGGVFVFADDTVVWQGQYYNGTVFNVGTFSFNFTVFDAVNGGVACYSNVTSLTTGSFGQWRTEQNGVGSGCDNSSKDYF